MSQASSSQASTATASPGPSNARQTGNKRMRTEGPEVLAGLYTAMPSPKLGKRTETPKRNEGTPLKRTRFAEAPDAISRKEDTRARASEWLIHDIRQRCRGDVELLAFIDERIKHYSTDSNVPLSPPGARPAPAPTPTPKRNKPDAEPVPLRTPLNPIHKIKRERSSSPTPNGSPSKKSRVREASPTIIEDDTMDVDEQPPAQPRRAEQPSAFKRFAGPQAAAFTTSAEPRGVNATPPPSSPPRKPAPMSREEAQEEVKRSAGSPFAAFANAGGFPTQSPKRPAASSSNAGIDPQWTLPRTGRTPQSAIDVDVDMVPEAAAPASPTPVVPKQEPVAGPSGTQPAPEAKPAEKSERDVERAKAWIAKGDRLMTQHEHEGAIDSYLKAVDLDDSIENIIKLCRGQLAVDAWQDALEWLEEVFEKSADIPLMVDCASIFKTCYAYKAAADVYEWILQLDPANDAAAQGIQECDTMKATSAEASAFLKEKRWKRALNYLDARIAVTSRPPPDWQVKRLAAMLEMRPIEYNQGRTATAYLAKALPQDAEALYQQARFALFDEHDRDADLFLKKALERDPKHVGALSLAALVNVYKNAEAFFSRKDYIASEQTYTAALNGGLKTPAIYFMRATCRQLLKKYDQALSDCAESLLIKPAYHRALRRQGICYYYLGKKLSTAKSYDAASSLLDQSTASFKAALETLNKLVDSGLWDLLPLKTEVQKELANAEQLRFETAYNRKAKSTPKPQPKAAPKFDEEWKGSGFFPRGAPGAGFTYGTRSGAGARSSPRVPRRDNGLAGHYAKLGLPFGATIDEVRSTFKTLSRTRHPDKGGDQAAYQDLVNARDKLVEQLS